MKKLSYILFLFILLQGCDEPTPLPNSYQFNQQEWQLRNLDVTTFRNGDPIPEARTKDEWKKASEQQQPAWCQYENEKTNGGKYGKLYNWFAVNDPRGLAPEGWHVPADSEWTLLINYMGGADVAGKKMRKASFTEDGKNLYGFCAVAGGYRDHEGTFIGLGYYRNWWSATQETGSNPLIRSLSPNKNNVFRNTIPPGTGLAVRCVKD